MNKERIKKMALGSGFKLKEQPNGEMDLNPYVYEFVDMVESAILHKYESERKDRWINTKDRLPDMHKRVLIKSDTICVAGRVPKSEYNDNWGVKGDWYWAVANDLWIDAHMVSHWQPLPEIPEEVRND